ncbi:MAG: WG repeat-containing protein, partial [Clostridia bacterium]
NRNDNRNATDVNNRNDNRNATDVNNRNDNRFGNQRKYDPNSKGYNGGGQGQNVQGRGAQNGQGQYVQSRVNVQDNRGSNQRGNNNASRNNQQFGQRLVGHTQDERNAFYNANRGLNDSLTRQYAGLSMSEILMGKRERPIAQPLPREQLTPESIVKFCRQGKWGYKDWKGNVLIQPTFDEAYSFYEGMACVERAGKLGFINAKGEVVIDFVYDTATSFSEGFASVTKDEKTGYIDKDGKQVIDFVYEIATPFHDGRAVVFVDGRWGVLGADFKVMWR